VVEEVLDRGAVALAAEAVGGAQRCLDMAVAHARARVQFGRPIGSFQAVQHKLADVLVGVEAARSVVAAAAAAVDDPERDDVPLLASTAKAYCAESFVRAASESIQVHGGVGFTWDHDAHLYLKRARSSALLLGDPAWHRERVARLLDL
jgi:alkylation response protein AidB-like acyl-CoA dehydrogenase